VKLKELGKVLSDIANNPTVISDQDFEKKLKDVQGVVEALWNEARHGAGSMSHVKILLCMCYNAGGALNFATA
jgi:hypothetical protein